MRTCVFSVHIYGIQTGMAKKNKQGGRRPGAGRPRLHRVRLTAQIEAEQDRLIDKHRRDTGQSHSEAVRSVIHLGLVALGLRE